MNSFPTSGRTCKKVGSIQPNRVQQTQAPVLWNVMTGPKMHHLNKELMMREVEAQTASCVSILAHTQPVKYVRREWAYLRHKHSAEPDQLGRHPHIEVHE